MKRWEKKRTAETRAVEELLKTKFPHADAYRFNSASIRVRIIDECFEGKSPEKREATVLPLLKQLPPDTFADIINLLLLSPSEARTTSDLYPVNLEFERPSRSTL